MSRVLAGVLVCVLLGQAQSVGAARLLEQAGQFERAFVEYRRVLERQPQDRAAYDGFRRVCVELGRFDSLVAVSQRLAQDQPGQVMFELGRIEGLFGLKQRAQALAASRQAFEMFPRQVVQIADLLERSGERNEAVRLLLEARGRTESELLYAERLIELYETQKRYTEAVREIVRIVNNRPDELARHLERIWHYAKQAGSGYLLTELGRIAGSWPRARAEAQVLLAVGKEAEAVRVAKSGLSRDGLYGFAHECEELGALNAALALYQEQNLYADQARALRKLGRTDEALRVLAQDQSPEAVFELAELYRLETRQYDKAVAQYGRYLERRPEDEPGRFGLASSLLALGKLEPARQSLVLVANQTDRAMFLLARVLLYQAEPDSARAAVAGLAQRFPGSVLLNDALELRLLTYEAERGQELASAMLAAETGALGKARQLCQVLGSGSDAVAELAVLLQAKLLREAGEPKQALAVLGSFDVRFRASPRRARARLDQAEILLEDLGDENKYRQTLEDLVVQFPGSAYAPVARSLLAEASRPGVEPGEVH